MLREKISVRKTIQRPANLLSIKNQMTLINTSFLRFSIENITTSQAGDLNQLYPRFSTSFSIYSLQHLKSFKNGRKSCPKTKVSACLEGGNAKMPILSSNRRQVSCRQSYIMYSTAAHCASGISVNQ